MPHCLQKCVLDSGATAFLLHIMWLAIGLQSAKGTSGTPTISCGIFTANSCPPSGPLVVMKRVSRSTPPNVTLVGDFTGTSTTMSTRPSRVRRMTRDAPEIATHKQPAQSHCAPSGKPGTLDGSSYSRRRFVSPEWAS